MSPVEGAGLDDVGTQKGELTSFRSTVPERPVRGRTRAGRLRLFDAYLRRYQRPLFTPDARVIDVGVGCGAQTTVELARGLRLLELSLDVVGLEREASRLPTVDGEVRFEVGGFERLAQLGPACLVRAMNVLRGYREDEVPAAHQALLAPLVPKGLLLEGSTDTPGDVGVAHLLRRDGVGRGSLLFVTSFARGFAPWMFRDWLPRDLRRKALPGTQLFAFFTEWTRAFEEVRDVAPSSPLRFERSAGVLQQRVDGVELLELETGAGLTWTPALSRDA